MRLQSKLFAIIFTVTASLLVSFSLIVYAIVSHNVNQLVSQQSEILAEQVLDLAEISYQANQEAVRHYLQVADHFVQNRATLATDQEISLVAKNQETGSTQSTQLSPLLIDGQNVATDHEFVDLITQLTGATATIFQMIPQGLLRVSTSVRDETGDRAIGTYIPAASPVYQAVQRGEVYEGLAFVVDNWYITEYEPIRNQAGSIIGALYVGIQQSKLDILRDKIADIRVGKSGFAYIIDGDGNILVHPDFVGETIADHPQLQPILETSKGVLTLAAEAGRDRIDYVDYLDVMDWHVGIATYPDETFALPRRIALLLGVMTAIGVIAAGLVGRLVGHYVANPVAKVAKAMQHVAAGNLAVKSAGIRSRDEVGTLSRSVDQMVERLSAVVGSIKTSATQLSRGSGDLTHTSERVAAGATQQAVSVNEIAASMAQIRSTIQHSAKTAQETQIVAAESAAQAQAGGDAVLETVAAMNRIVKEIRGVEEIARNTNLLALNAAVEAANAGDTSEEFAVVAREVRRLAQQSGQTAAEISQVSQSSIAIAERTGQLLQKLVPRIQQTAAYVQQIALAAAEQQSGAEQITQAVDQLNGVVQQNAAAAQDLEAMATTLATQAQSLSATVAFFSVSDIVSEQQPSHPTTLAASFR